jgi:hypothetical protein
MEPPQDGRTVRGTYTHTGYTEEYVTDEPFPGEPGYFYTGWRGGMAVKVDPVWEREISDWLWSETDLTAWTWPG